MDVILELFNSPAVSFWLQILIDGFLAGALPGSLIGIIVFATMGRTGSGNLIMIISAGLIGLIVGLFLSGGPLFGYLGAGSDAAIRATSGTQVAVFESVVGVLQWVIGGLALGCFMMNVRRAIWGGVLGILTGTLSGVILSQMRVQFIPGLNNPLTTVLVAITSLVMILIIALLQD